MSNEYIDEEVLETEEEVEETDDVEESTDDESDTTEQPRETPEARLARLTRMKAQLEKKLGLSTEKESKPSKKGALDYSQKAFLIANGIKGNDEFGLVQEVMKSTGKSLDDIIESKYFKAELNELRELNKSADANPASGNRSGNSARNTVEYWIAKGELPPASEVDLRRKVVNARMNKAKSVATFYNS